MPINGIWKTPGWRNIAIVSGCALSRNMKEIIIGGPNRTYAFPNTTTVVAYEAFNDMLRLSAVRLNNGLETLEANCFCNTRIRELVLPASVKQVQSFAFSGCKSLRYANLSAARGLTRLEKLAFCSCERLRSVLLNDGLESIEEECFCNSGLSQVTVPRSVKLIGKNAFKGC